MSFKVYKIVNQTPSKSPMKDQSFKEEEKKKPKKRRNKSYLTIEKDTVKWEKIKNIAINI